MSETPFRRKGARPLADLVGDRIAPACRKRGFASADLIAFWPDIVGPLYRDCTQPERLSWPRRLADGGEEAFEPAVLTVRCMGARAVLFQHEAPVVVERINATFGYRAVASIRIVQKPVEPRRRVGLAPAPVVDAATAAAIAEATSGVADPGLREALERLGRAVKGRPPAGGRGASGAK